jgi:RNA 2',3'-cyclic 3'-phosphodiesterase
MSRDGSARLFAALDPPGAVREQLALWARTVAREGPAGAPALRVLDPSSLHLTLLFLGELPPDEIPALGDALAEAAEDALACELELGAPVWLPPRRPRALAVEVRDRSGELEPLQRSVAATLGAAAGVQAPRRFRAHITVARVRGGPAPGAGAGSGPLPPTPQAGFTAREVVLYRSFLEPRAARYERVASVPLGGFAG